MPQRPLQSLALFPAEQAAVLVRRQLRTRQQLTAKLYCSSLPLAQIMELWNRVNPGVMPQYAQTPPSTAQDHFK